MQNNDWKYYLPTLLSFFVIAFMYAFPFFVVFMLSLVVFLFAIVYALMVNKFLKLRREFKASGQMGESPTEPNFKNITIDLMKRSKDNWGL